MKCEMVAFHRPNSDQLFAFLSAPFLQFCHVWLTLLVKIFKKHPIIIGPLLSEIGFNLPIKMLFWIEMVGSSNLFKALID